VIISFNSSFDAIIAIERAGPAQDGVCRTMRAFEMNHLVAPLELLLTPPSESGIGDGDVDTSDSNDRASHPLISIGIGDGGNEVGMGKIYQHIINSTIDNAQTIACASSTDHLIICHVSNWGGYALAAATAIMFFQSPLAATQPSLNLADALPSEEEQISACTALIEAGARDGISRLQELSVDGMPLAVSLQVLADIRELALKAEGETIL
jgi:D-glutamate cyclase